MEMKTTTMTILGKKQMKNETKKPFNSTKDNEKMNIDDVIGMINQSSIRTND